MTKHIRVENADMGNYKVLVQVWDKREEGPDILVSEQHLDYPTAMTQPHSIYLTDTLYVVVKENGKRDE